MSKKQFIRLKVGITIASFLLAVITKSKIDWLNLTNNYIDWLLVKEILYDLSIGVFSAMILVWFIDEIGYKIKEKQSKEKELASIKRFNKVVQYYIDRFELTFYCVVTPLAERKFQDICMPEDFTLKDMRDLYKTSLLPQDKFLGCSIESFLQIELELRKEFISLVQENDFEFYPRFSELLLKYIQTSLEFDSRSAILDATHTYAGKKRLDELISDSLENDAEKEYQRYLRGESKTFNLVHPCIFLYEMMKEERRILLQYKEEIEKLY